MKFFVKTGFFLFFPILLIAQSQPSQLDSLQLLLGNAPGDTARMNIYDQLGWYYAEINRDSALSYFEKELPISRKLKLRLYEADALNGMGYALEQLGNYPKSLESYLEAQKIARDPASEKNAWNLTNNAWNTSKSPDPKDARLDLLGWILHGIGELYGHTGNTNIEISNIFEARSLAASVRDTTSAGSHKFGTRILSILPLINWTQRFFFSKRRCPYIIARMSLENMKAMF